jgi:hypothetical protein
MTVDDYISWFRENAETLRPEVKHHVIMALDRNELVSSAKQLHLIRDKYGLPDNWNKILEDFFWTVY